jgi:hypothetical protein
MKQLAAVAIGLAVFCLTFGAFAANKPISFAGTWIIDPQKSDAFAKSSTSANIGAMGGMGGMGGMGSMGGRGGMSGMGGRGGMGRMSGMGGAGRMGGIGSAGRMSGMGSSSSESPGMGSSAPMIIEQSATEIRITRTVMGKQIVDSYKPDGKPVNEMVENQQSGSGRGGRAGFGQQQQMSAKIPRTTLAKLNKGTLDVKEVTAASNSKSTVKTIYTLSKDQKVLTVKISTTTSRPTGGGMGGGTTVTSQKLVYNKQADNP